MQAAASPVNGLEDSLRAKLAEIITVNGLQAFYPPQQAVAVLFEHCGMWTLGGSHRSV